jgi:hypothetical protein
MVRHGTTRHGTARYGTVWYGMGVSYGVRISKAIGSALDLANILIIFGLENRRKLSQTINNVICLPYFLLFYLMLQVIINISFKICHVLSSFSIYPGWGDLLFGE